LVRHELDHADDEEQAKENADPALISFQVEWDPAEKEVFHIGRGHEKDEGGTKPLLKIVFQFLLHLGHAHATPDDEAENRNGDEPDENAGQWFEYGLENGPTEEIAKHDGKELSGLEGKEK
jgi:hypothetical protein